MKAENALWDLCMSVANGYDIEPLLRKYAEEYSDPSQLDPSPNDWFIKGRQLQDRRPNQREEGYCGGSEDESHDDGDSHDDESEPAVPRVVSNNSFTDLERSFIQAGADLSAPVIATIDTGHGEDDGEEGRSTQEESDHHRPSKKRKLSISSPTRRSTRAVPLKGHDVGHSSQWKPQRNTHRKKVTGKSSALSRINAIIEVHRIFVRHSGNFGNSKADRIAVRSNRSM